MDANTTNHQLDEAIRLYHTIANKMNNPNAAAAVLLAVYVKAGIERLIRTNNPEAPEERWFVV